MPIACVPTVGHVPQQNDQRAGVQPVQLGTRGKSTEVTSQPVDVLVTRYGR